MFTHEVYASTYHQSRRHGGLQRVRKLMRVLAHAAVARSYCSDCFTQALLPTMPRRRGMVCAAIWARGPAHPPRLPPIILYRLMIANGRRRRRRVAKCGVFRESSRRTVRSKGRKLGDTGGGGGDVVHVGCVHDRYLREGQYKQRSMVSSRIKPLEHERVGRIEGMGRFEIEERSGPRFGRAVGVMGYAEAVVATLGVHTVDMYRRGKPTATFDCESRGVENQNASGDNFQIV
jgi:hypothetical protein